jgi:hypothetical protein
VCEVYLLVLLREILCKARVPCTIRLHNLLGLLNSLDLCILKWFCIGNGMVYELFWCCTLNSVALGMVFLLGFHNGDILCF